MYRLQNYYRFADFSTESEKHLFMNIWQDFNFLALSFGSRRKSPGWFLLEGASGLHLSAKLV
jgi:hypothetical protein